MLFLNSVLLEVTQTGEQELKTVSRMEVPLFKQLTVNLKTLLPTQANGEALARLNGGLPSRDRFVRVSGHVREARGPFLKGKPETERRMSEFVPWEFILDAVTLEVMGQD
jgi:hypothetical protein